MKLRYIYIIVLCILTSGCNYLDIMPDERAKLEDSYNTPSKTEGFLYSCYTYMPMNRSSQDSQPYRSWYPTALLTGGEVTTYYKANEPEQLFTMGLYNPTNNSIVSDRWWPTWKGVRQCYEFLDILDKAQVYTEADREIYRAEAKFLIAYYHFCSLQAFGPTLIIRKKYDLDTKLSELPARSSYDEVVAFIDQMLDEAMPGLVEAHNPMYFGRATKHVARALRSRVHLYAASPLFNGNSEFYSNFVDENGKHLISQTYDVKKWEKCAEVTLDAIQNAEKAGYKLYGDVEAGAPTQEKPGFTDQTESGKAQRRVRYCTIDNQNLCEIIWGDNRSESTYGVQIRSSVRQTKQIPYTQTNSTAPTLQMVELFYTEHGFPIDKDKTYDYPNRYQIAYLPANFDGNNYEDRPNDRSIKLHFNREPRFYSWIGFHNGNYEIARYNAEALPLNKSYVPGGLRMLFNGAHGFKKDMTVHYSVTGYLNKKFTHPGFTNAIIKYPFPTFRLAELYLNYAEALIEIGGSNNLKIAKEYMDKVRKRAGIPGVDESIQKYANDEWKGKENEQETLRQFVRQERQIEFYLEGQRFWDLRRWKIAEKLDEPFLCWNIEGASVEEFFKAPQPNMTLTNHFYKSQYLLPISASELEKTPQIIQNPFY